MDLATRSEASWPSSGARSRALSGPRRRERPTSRPILRLPVAVELDRICRERKALRDRPAPVVDPELLVNLGDAERPQLARAILRGWSAERRTSEARFRSVTKRLEQTINALRLRWAQVLADRRTAEAESADDEQSAADEVTAAERPPPDAPPQLVDTLAFAPGAPGARLVAQL